MTDDTGKEFTLFLAPGPIKGNLLNKSNMFGSQLPYLSKQEETSAKYGKHTSMPKKGEDGAKPRRKPDFGSGGPDIGQLVQHVLSTHGTSSTSVIRVERREPSLPLQHPQAIPEE